MEDTNTGSQISALKELLLAQQEALKKLQLELEIERESAATAASEALSMILRLQGEKAAKDMEARQYKIMTEEKLNHAEESLFFCEELMHFKEMRISFLELQLQACRNKLRSVGFYDFGSGATKDLEAPSCFPHLCSIGRRVSLPPMGFKHSKLEIISSEKGDFELQDREWDLDVETFSGIGLKPADNIIIGVETSLLGNTNSEHERLEVVSLIGSSTVEKTGDELDGHFYSSNIDANALVSSYSVISKDIHDSEPEEDFICALSISQAESSKCSLYLDPHISSEVGYASTSTVAHDVYEIPQNEKEITHHGNVNYHIASRSFESVVVDAEDKKRKCTAKQFLSSSSAVENVDNKIHDPAVSRSDYLIFDQRLRRLENNRSHKEVQQLEGWKRETQLLSKISDQLGSTQMPIKDLKPDNSSLPEEYMEYMDYFTQVMLSISL